MVVVNCVCCVCIGMRSTSDTVFQKLSVFGDTRVLGYPGLRLSACLKVYLPLPLSAGTILRCATKPGSSLGSRE